MVQRYRQTGRQTRQMNDSYQSNERTELRGKQEPGRAVASNSTRLISLAPRGRLVYTSTNSLCAYYLRRNWNDVQYSTHNIEIVYLFYRRGRGGARELRTYPRTDGRNQLTTDFSPALVIEAVEVAVEQGEEPQHLSKVSVRFIN